MIVYWVMTGKGCEIKRGWCHKGDITDMMRAVEYQVGLVRSELFKLNAHVRFWTPQTGETYTDYQYAHD
jgi:hypothetical protein